MQPALFLIIAELLHLRYLNFCGQLIFGMDDASFCMQADAVIGCLIFMILPERILMNGNLLADKISEPGGEKLVNARMEFAAGALVDVRKNVEDIIKALESKSVSYSNVEKVSENDGSSLK